jgi:hypothetical protein
MPGAINMGLAFAGREPEVKQLRALFAERKNVVLIGPAGIGKSALLSQMKLHSSLLICEDTSKLSRICDALERQLGWTHVRLNVIERKNRLIQYIERRGQPVAFDQISQTPPRIARFMAHLSQHVPVWIVCRSELPHDIGRVWEYLAGFVRVHVGPLTRTESQLLVRQAVENGAIQKDALQHLPLLHRISHGNPRILENLFVEMAARDYKMGTSFGRALLDLDRRIGELTTDIQQGAPG